MVAAATALDWFEGLTSEEQQMDDVNQPNGIVRWTLRLEQFSALDRPVHALEPVTNALFGSGPLAPALRGDWLGHAVHPVLTDVAVGTWLSASVLDLVGGPGASAAAQRLVAAGLVSAAPTAWTGWAEWAGLGPRDKRVGLVHFATNGVAIGLYAASWFARRRGRHGAGVRLALAGAAVAGVGAYLGGHLTEGRAVASHHPAYDEPTARA